jgi:endo-1,4-beta-xylanase
MGFSAGGEVAALTSLKFDAGMPSADDAVERESCRPTFQALIYPGRSQRIEVTQDSPPAFLVCGFQDRPDISRGLADVYLKFHEAGVPAELHIYAQAGHGFGYRPNRGGVAADWPELFLKWVNGIKTDAR